MLLSGSVDSQVLRHAKLQKGSIKLETIHKENCWSCQHVLKLGIAPRCDRSRLRRAHCVLCSTQLQRHDFKSKYDASYTQDGLCSIYRSNASRLLKAETPRRADQTHSRGRAASKQTREVTKCWRERERTAINYRAGRVFRFGSYILLRSPPCKNMPKCYLLSLFH